MFYLLAFLKTFLSKIHGILHKGVGRKIFRGEMGEGNGKTTQKNRTINPPSTLSVSCMKI